jgi:catechol 2,3-dioxygenase-like lactoylglutathione lyase family enzyme
MKRFHVHVSVSDLTDSIRFYSRMFGAEPSVLKDDYAKWMLDDPRINFAISMKRQPLGVNHLGFQVDSDEELRGMQGQLEAADAQMLQEDEQPCCYAKSDKYWETFHSLSSIPVYGEDTPVFGHGASVVPIIVANPQSGCCVPEPKMEAPATKSSCCGTNESRA